MRNVDRTLILLLCIVLVLSLAFAYKKLLAQSPIQTFLCDDTTCYVPERLMMGILAYIRHLEKQAARCDKPAIKS